MKIPFFFSAGSKSEQLEKGPLSVSTLEFKNILKCSSV